MSKTIKIIDLFIKHTKPEIQPAKIKYRGKKYVYNGYAVLQQIIEDYGKDIVILLEDEVEIIEEQEEIDIQDIEDVNLFDNGQNFNEMPIIIKSYDDNFTNINNIINKLVQAVKQLELKIKEKQ